MIRRAHVILCVTLLATGCAGLEVSDAPLKNAFTFHDPVPVLITKISGDCSIATESGSYPGKPRYLRMRSGYGSSKLSAAFSNGVLTTVGQEVDTKIPETLTAAGGFAKNLADANFLYTAPGAKTCVPRVVIQPLVYGVNGKFSVGEAIYDKSAAPEAVAAVAPKSDKAAIVKNIEAACAGDPKCAIEAFKALQQ